MRGRIMRGRVMRGRVMRGRIIAIRSITMQYLAQQDYTFNVVLLEEKRLKLYKVLTCER